MRRLTQILALAALSLVSRVALRAEEPPVAPATPARPDFARLVEDLGSPDFAEREAASAALAEAGESAREALQKALESKDPEVQARSRILLDALEGRRKAKTAPPEPERPGVRRPVRVMPIPGIVMGNAGGGVQIQVNLNGRQVQLDQDDLARLEALKGREVEGLGVRCASCPEELAAQLKIPGGVLVRDCGGKPEGLDLEVHDVIVAAAGAALGDPEALQKLLEAAAGKPLELTLYRRGERKTVTVASPKP